MKSVLLLCFLVAVLAFTHSSRIEKDGVFDKIQAYGRQPAAPNQRSCYETYNSKTAQLNAQIERGSDDCIMGSDAKRNVELEKAQKERGELDRLATVIQDSMSKCVDTYYDLESLTCFLNGTKADLKILAEKEERSLDLFKHLNQTYEAIQNAENHCIDSLNETASRESLMHDLQNCLQNSYAQN